MATKQIQPQLQLQINGSGAWKTVLKFDAGDAAQMDNIKAGVLMLTFAAPLSYWRIASCDGKQSVVCHIGRNTYGIWMGSHGSL